jgi:hypothetical protein
MILFNLSFIKKGSTLPNNIISSGRELWFRFNTDDSIELKGFRILYEFTPAQNSGFLYNSNIYHQNRLLGNFDWKFTGLLIHSFNLILECEMTMNNQELKNGDGNLNDEMVQNYYIDKLNQLRKKLDDDDNFINDKFIECTINIEVNKNEKVKTKLLLLY